MNCNRCKACGGCTCGMPMHMSVFGHCPGCKNPEQPDDSLTFAEAMALPETEVEISFTGSLWRPLHEQVGHLRTAKFRRSRPKRSLVQEMAGHLEGRQDEYTKYAAVDMERAIRAVCEYLRKPHSSLFAQLASKVEGHFLEPR